MKTSIPVTEIVYGAMGTADVQKANVKEFEMALQDHVMEDTKDRKNVTESYVYDIRDKLSDIYQEFVTDSERENFIAKLQEMEDWLYEIERMKLGVFTFPRLRSLKSKVI
ncbi:hypothetical protein KY284_030233 [Solanum tuberosum]|nr:hypothetical protein KY284_030233 [Solanum tuberosum]